ncbi:MAG: hypothetical protein AAF485_22565 [Chloroflexota bacterium]
MARAALKQWYDQTRDKLRTLHGFNAALAKGGVERMGFADFGGLGGLTKFQYGKFDNFAQQLLDGKQPLNGFFFERVGLYVKAGRGTYWEQRRRDVQLKGLTEERRRLTRGKEHCRTNSSRIGCVEWADMGWQPLGTLGRLGNSPCLTRCGCVFQWRKGPGGKVFQ